MSTLKYFLILLAIKTVCSTVTGENTPNQISRHGIKVIPQPPLPVASGPPAGPTTDEKCGECNHYKPMTCDDVKKILGIYYKKPGHVGHQELGLLYFGDQDVKTAKHFPLEDCEPDMVGNPGPIDPAMSSIFIVIHGYFSGPDNNFIMSLVQSLKEVGIKHVFALDASNYVQYSYLSPAKVIRRVGESLGKMLAKMIKKVGITPDDIHLIGHSFGAHVAGVAGRVFTNRTGSKIARISGLDPSGTCFMHHHEELRLDAGCAKFVDVIHTDDSVFGMNIPLGDVDFYPNGGAEQPGCRGLPCNHFRATELYALSITSPIRFISQRCSTFKKYLSGECDRNEVSHLGFGANPNLEGLFYLKTSSKAPFDFFERPQGSPWMHPWK